MWQPKPRCVSRRPTQRGRQSASGRRRTAALGIGSAHSLSNAHLSRLIWQFAHNSTAPLAPSPTARAPTPALSQDDAVVRRRRECIPSKSDAADSCACPHQDIMVAVSAWKAVASVWMGVCAAARLNAQTYAYQSYGAKARQPRERHVAMRDLNVVRRKTKPSSPPQSCMPAHKTARVGRGSVAVVESREADMGTTVGSCRDLAVSPPLSSDPIGRSPRNDCQQHNESVNPSCH